MRSFTLALFVTAFLLLASCTGTRSAPSATASSIASSTPSISVTTVPDVVGFNFGTARHAIREAGLSWKLSVVTSTYVQAAIVRQNPPPGTVLEPGATVHIVSGPA